MEAIAVDSNRGPIGKYRKYKCPHTVKIDDSYSYVNN